jgi:spermidine synthase
VAALAVMGAVLGANRWDRKLLGIGVYYLPHSTIDWSDIRGSVDRAAAGFRLTSYVEGFGDTITSLQTPDGKVITINGSATASTDFNDMFSQRMMGHLPMALHPGPVRKVCVIGLGAGITAGGMAVYRPEEMTVVELERGVLEASRFFEEENHHVLDDPAVTVVLDDGMIYLRATRERFDVISSHPNFPSLTGSGTLFSTDYFELCRARLAPGGIVCHYAPLWRTAHEDLMTILASFVEVFDHVRVFNTGLSLVLLGSVEPFPATNVEELSRRVARPEVAASLAEVGVHGAMDLLSFYALDEEELRPLTHGAPLNTTDFPLVEYRAPRSVFAATVATNLEALRSAEPGLEAAASRLGLSGDDRASYLDRASAFRTTLDAEIAFSRNETDRAMEMLIPVAQSGQRYAAYLLASRAEKLGRIALASGRLPEARDLFEVAAHFDPGRREARNDLAYVESLLQTVEDGAAAPPEGSATP